MRQVDSDSLEVQNRVRIAVWCLQCWDTPIFLRTPSEIQISAPLHATSLSEGGCSGCSNDCRAGGGLCFSLHLGSDGCSKPKGGGDLTADLTEESWN